MTENQPQYLKIDEKYAEFLNNNGGDEPLAIQEAYRWAINAGISPVIIVAWMAWKAY